MDRQEAFKLYTGGQSFKARIGGQVSENVFLKSVNDGSANPPTVTLLMPTPIGEPDRIRTWRMDQVEVLA